MTIKFNKRQAEKLRDEYTLKRVNRGGKLYLTWRDSNGRTFKSQKWSPKNGVTKTTALSAAKFYERVPVEKQKQLHEDENRIVSFTWEEENPDPKEDSKAYMEVRVILQTNSEAPKDPKRLYKWVLEHLSKKDRELVEKWRDIFEKHGVSPSINIGTTTESERILVEIDVHKKRFKKVDKSITEYL